MRGRQRCTVRAGHSCRPRTATTRCSTGTAATAVREGDLSLQRLAAVYASTTTRACRCRWSNVFNKMRRRTYPTLHSRTTTCPVRQRGAHDQPAVHPQVRWQRAVSAGQRRYRRPPLRRGFFFPPPERYPRAGSGPTGQPGDFRKQLIPRRARRSTSIVACPLPPPFAAAGRAIDHRVGVLRCLTVCVFVCLAAAAGFLPAHGIHRGHLDPSPRDECSGLQGPRSISTSAKAPAALSGRFGSEGQTGMHLRRTAKGGMRQVPLDGAGGQPGQRLLLSARAEHTCRHCRRICCWSMRTARTGWPAAWSTWTWRTCHRCVRCRHAAAQPGGGRPGALAAPG